MRGAGRRQRGPDTGYRADPRIGFIGTFGLCHALIRTGFAIEDVDVPRVYGGPFMRAAARAFRLGKRVELPENVRAMLSSPRVLCGRTAVIGARLPEDVPPAG